MQNLRKYTFVEENRDYFGKPSDVRIFSADCELMYRRWPRHKYPAISI
jgi:hypothetical protein